MKDRGNLYAGTSGYDYKSWHGRFYPAGTDKRLLRFYANRFEAVEINRSFYRMPTVKALQDWENDVHAGFLLCLKMSRFITHNKKLLDPGAPVARFFETANQLRPASRGPVLLQLPPNLKPQYQRLDETLGEIARHGDWRVAVEMRNDAWLKGDALHEIMDRHGAALVVHDMPRGRTVRPNDGADFVYIRYHGPAGDYHGEYGEAGLAPTAKAIRGWLEQGRDVFAFFNNDADGYAPFDAMLLRRMVNG